MIATRERPILMSAPMVRAILEGRKTQTRRVLSPQPDDAFGRGGRNVIDEFYLTGTEVSTGRQQWIARSAGQPVYAFREGKHSVRAEIACPYGAPGDRLWVRETWASALLGDQPVFAYRADGDDTDRWRPSIFMPRAACRLVLEVTGVRIERLQEITEEDAQAEGAAGLLRQFSRWPGRDDPGEWTAREEFESLWEHLNEKRGQGWGTNPWVWVVAFRKVEP